jgi:hypothetical protein
MEIMYTFRHVSVPIFRLAKPHTSRSKNLLLLCSHSFATFFSAHFAIPFQKEFLRALRRFASFPQDRSTIR